MLASQPPGTGQEEEDGVPVTTYFHSRVTGHNHVASCSCQVGWEAQPLAGPLRVCPELGVGVAEVVGGAHY